MRPILLCAALALALFVAAPTARAERLDPAAPVCTADGCAAAADCHAAGDNHNHRGRHGRLLRGDGPLRRVLRWRPLRSVRPFGRCFRCR